MKEFEELQEIWQKGDARVPIDFETLMKRIESGKRGLATKFGWHILAFAVILVCLVVLWVMVPFVTWTSHLALFIVAICLSYAMIMQYRLFVELRWGLSADSLERPAAYIVRLKRLHQNSYRRHTRNFRTYGVCLALALALFSLELYFAVSLGVFVALILFVIAWFLVAYFFFAKVYLANESNKIRELIGDLERIQQQVE